MYKSKKTRHTNALQSMKIKGVIVILILFAVILSSISLVSSAPPFVSPEISSVSTLQVESPNLPIAEVGADKRFHAHVINATSLKTNKTTSCALHVYNQTGFDFNIPQWMEFETYNGIDFAMTVTGGNFTTVGTYAYVIQCNSSAEVGFYRGQFAVTPNGEVADSGTAVFYFGVIFVLLFFLGLCIYSFAEFDNLLNRVGMLGVAYILLIAISFIGWNMAQDFLMSSQFIIDMMRIIFLVLVIGFFPLVIAGFIYYFLALWKIKEIQGLMNKGMSGDEAQRRVNRR